MVWNNTIAKHGFGDMDVIINPNDGSSRAVQFYAAGYLEGKVTAESWDGIFLSHVTLNSITSVVISVGNVCSGPGVCQDV